MPYWYLTSDGDEYCLDLFRKHYSYKNSREYKHTKCFVGPGEKLVLRTWEADAMFVWRKFISDSKEQGIYCSVFRNESKTKSSDLIKEADKIADAVWPNQRHYTYVDAKKVKSTNAGYCFKRAGWKVCGKTKINKLVILEREVKNAMDN